MRNAATNPSPLPSLIDGALGRAGDWLARNAKTIAVMQGAMLALYLLLLIGPVLVPLPDDEARLRDNVVLIAQFVFWGIWWPLVMISMLVLGRVWCGLLCPEGALSEWASRLGRGGAIPAWLRWPGWPFVAFTSTTVYGQLITVYQYPKATLLILGGSTVAAVAVGLLYGSGRRVWCRHLCPAGGVFALLARLAPIHFRVDPMAWQSAPPAAAIVCPALVDIRTMRGSSACQMCGRCSGHREAVRLQGRAVHRDILALPERAGASWDVILLVFGLMGVATGAFHWSASPGFVWLKQGAAASLVAWDWGFLLEAQAPWYLLTHYPEVHDSFSWLDGLAILAYIALTTLVIGLPIGAGLHLAARWVLRPGMAWRLAYGLTPLAAVGLILGLGTTTLAHLRSEGIVFGSVGLVQMAAMTLGLAWSGWLIWRLLPAEAAGRKPAAGLAALAGVGPYLGLWGLFFLVW